MRSDFCTTAAKTAVSVQNFSRERGENAKNVEQLFAKQCQDLT